MNTVYNNPYKELFCFLWVTMIAWQRACSWCGTSHASDWPIVLYACMPPTHVLGPFMTLVGWRGESFHLNG